MSGASSQLSAFNYAVQPLGNLQIKNITASYTVSPSDSNFILNCTGTTSYIIAMPPASSLPSGFNFVVWNNTTTAAMAVTIDPNASETIDGVATLILRRGEGAQIVCDGTNWQTGNKKTMRLYADNSSATATRPIASGDLSISMGQGATASGAGSLALGGNGSYTGVSTSSGTGSLAIQGGTAGANYSTAIGVNGASNTGSVTATGAGAMALGGSYASGVDSFAAAIANNTSTYGAKGANSIAMNDRAVATGGQSIAIGQLANASGVSSVAIAGYLCNASGTASLAMGANYYVGTPTASAGSSIAIGDGSNASQKYSTAFGVASVSAVYGKYAYAGGIIAAAGDSQYGLINLRGATTDATAKVLTSDNAAASTTNQVILPNNSAYAVTGTVICRQSVAGSDKASGWTFTAVIRRGANAASTALVAAVTPVLIAQDVSLATTALAVTADTTNGGLAVTVTGIAATNLRWVATIQTSEVTYA